MAETDGTPRYRKSKPPSSKGANGRNASSRNTRPNGKARKRAELNSTLPTGAALDQTDNVEKVELGAGEAAQPKAENRETHVVKTMPTVIRAEPVAEPEVVAAAPDALADVVSSGSRAKLQRGPNPSMLRSKRPLLASTLRMELTVHRNEGSSEPEISVRPTPSWTDGSNAWQGPDAVDAVDTRATFQDEGATTLQESPPRSRKPTAPGGFDSTFEDIPVRARGRERTVNQEQPAVLEETVRRGSDIAADANPNVHTPRPRRPRRPGERTLIMTRRDTKQNSKRDWLFVVMLVAALGLTASMILSRQAPAETDEAQDAAAYEDQQEEEQQRDQFATTLQPYKAKPAPVDKPSATQIESSISASTVQATELRSLPSGAEVVAGNAVVGSTPVRVARGSTEMTYTLRLPGHQPKLVRVGPQSPPSIMVELLRNVSGVATAPGTTGVGRFSEVGGTIQPSEPPADVPAAAPSGSR